MMLSVEYYIDRLAEIEREGKEGGESFMKWSYIAGQLTALCSSLISELANARSEVGTLRRANTYFESLLSKEKGGD